MRCKILGAVIACAILVPAVPLQSPGHAPWSSREALS